MASFVVAAAALSLCLVPLGASVLRSTTMGAVVAYEAASAIFVMVLVLLPEGFARTGLFEFPVLMAGLLLGGGLVFVRAAERWL